MVSATAGRPPVQSTINKADPFGWLANEIQLSSLSLPMIRVIP
jgi:hypothetical protein